MRPSSPEPLATSLCSCSSLVLSFKDTLRVAAVLNSYVLTTHSDFGTRDLNVSWFVLAEMPVPRAGDIPDSVAQLALKLNWHPRYFPDIKGLDTGFQPETYETDELVRAKIREEIDAEIASVKRSH